MKPILTLHTPAKAQSYYGNGLWTADTFYSLLVRHAGERPEAWAVRDSARRLTWAELRDRTDDIAARLHAADLRPGDRVSLWMSSRIEAVIGFLACARNGYICNPSLHQNYTVDEIVTLLGRIRAGGLIAEEGYGADAAHKDPFGPISALEGMKTVIRLPGDRVDGGDLAAPVSNAPPVRADDPDAVAYLAFTSGTTGMPKGVMHSANTLMANGRDMVRDWGHDSSTILLSLSPVSHHIAWVGLGQALTAGAEFVVNDPPAGMKPLDWIIETGATYVMGVPTHAMDIQAEQRRRGLERIGDVTVFYMAGAAIPPAVAENFLKQGIKPQNVYGMSENSSHQYTQPDDDAATIVSTCGRGGKAYEIAIFDMEDADKPAAPGTVGQIGGRGACLMLGYFGNQQATEDSFNKDGWFLSGDLGRIDKDGNLEVAGRLKDMIIRGGKNIYPAKIDDLAVKHPGVDKAAAFPVPDERLGERVCLAILPHAGAAPGAEEMLEHLHKAGLSKYDMPEYFIVMPELPMTASGKILKRELAAWAKSGDIAPQPCRFVDPAKKAS